MFRVITPTPLTAADLDLLQALADGESLKLAGERLFGSEGIAKNRMVEIRDYLEATTSANAVAIAIRQELID